MGQLKVITSVLVSLLFTTMFNKIHAIPVQNGVIGEPEVGCNPLDVTINFSTEEEFQGHVYVKGLYAEDDCRSDEGGRLVAGITLPLTTCNLQRRRSLEPAGVFVDTTVVIQFHPQFVTKVDRAYRISCFYMEADKTVSAELEVSMLTTALQTAIVPMPACRYEILDGGPTGQPATYVSVGQSVYHKWTCDSETVDTFCMKVHSCFVDDGQGDQIVLLGQDGCALDKFLLQNIEYQTDLMAGQEAHVFKYADKNQLYFQCQIAIEVKEPGSDCRRDACPEPQSFGAVPVNIRRQLTMRRRRFRRTAALETDVTAQITSLDLTAVKSCE